MSNKETLYLYEYSEPKELHIYKDSLSYAQDKWFIEDVKGNKVELPENVALKFVGALKKESEVQHGKF